MTLKTHYWEDVNFPSIELQIHCIYKKNLRINFLGKKLTSNHQHLDGKKNIENTKNSFEKENQS